MTDSLLVNNQSPNVFRSLLPYRGREGRESRENFLTESLAYLVATEASVRGALISALTEDAFRGATLQEITTQCGFAQDDDIGRCIPDMIFYGRDRTSQAFEIWVENKWGSPASRPQLARYKKAISRMRSADKTRRHLVFVSPRTGDKAAAADIPPHDIPFTATTWAALHDAISRTAKSVVALEFLSFLQSEGLGPLKPLTLKDAIDHHRMTEGNGREHRGHPFRHQCKALAHALLADPRISEIAGLEEAVVHNGYGRVGIWSHDGKVCAGLHYNNTDHKTVFVNAKSPLDLTIRIQAEPKGADVDSARNAFSALADALEAKGFDCNPGKGSWRGNAHTILLGHYRNGFPFECGSGVEQQNAVAEIFRRALLTVYGSAKWRSKVEELPGYGI